MLLAVNTVLLFWLSVCMCASEFRWTSVAQPGARPFRCRAYEGAEHKAAVSVFGNPGSEGSSKGNVGPGFQLALHVRSRPGNVLIPNELCCSFCSSAFNNLFLIRVFFCQGL